MDIEDSIWYTLRKGRYSDKQTTKLSVPFSPLMYRLDTKLTIDSFISSNERRGGKWTTSVYQIINLFCLFHRTVKGICNHNNNFYKQLLEIRFDLCVIQKLQEYTFLSTFIIKAFKIFLTFTNK